MKKQPVYWLLLATCVFAALLVGFLAGRNLNLGSVQISHLPQVTYPDESTAPSQTLPPLETVPQKININTATSEQLQMLPGIGPVLAQRIIQYRSVNGPFETLLDLLNVKGIGLERINEILDYATVGG